MVICCLQKFFCTTVLHIVLSLNLHKHSTMAYQNKVISNTKTGQQLRFLQTAEDTDGSLLEMEAHFAPYSKEPPPHFHPQQKEDFTVIAGEVLVNINGASKTFKAGDRFHVPANTVHSMWNNSNKETIVNWRVQPALDSEYFFETLTGLANDNKTNDAGVPGMLQTALLMGKFSNVYRPAKPPFFIQKLVFSILSPFAYLFGYKEIYRKYID